MAKAKEKEKLYVGATSQLLQPAKYASLSLKMSKRVCLLKDAKLMKLISVWQPIKKKKKISVTKC